MSLGVEENAKALLEAMNTLQAKGRTDYRLDPTDPKVLERAGLEYSHIDDAMWWLLDNGMMRHVDDEISAQARTIVGQPEYGLHHHITNKGLAWLA